VSDDDFVVLEDSSGRIRVRKSDKFNPSYFVTGSIIALKGVSDNSGFFTVDDFCYASIPFN
jgi:DNA polymerase delta subunit 2